MLGSCPTKHLQRIATSVKSLIVGTKNPDKLREIQDILLAVPVDLRPVPGEVPEAPEDEPTLDGNARSKASFYAKQTQAYAIADDTGLEVDAIGGAPGVYSARYAGPDATYGDNRQKLIQALDGMTGPRRNARFRCVVALADPAGKILGTAEGVLEGRILHEEIGQGGFGYDPIFRPDGDQRTLATMSEDEKNGISHRARALEAIKPELLRLL